ncbi:hypothetical protein DIT68_15170 [Brumimicrobium oceani]|uniref:Uncharacterized protein n=1 Tax=Brumimicrobium oceani TaxID=2100725 RepID=A0A2U2X0Q4_9FLAO|nr:hypothetical protein DIT68_15170 [Brumimicrobium oceani]
MGVLLCAKWFYRRGHGGFAEEAEILLSFFVVGYSEITPPVVRKWFYPGGLGGFAEDTEILLSFLW